MVYSLHNAASLSCRRLSRFDAEVCEFSRSCTWPFDTHESQPRYLAKLVISFSLETLLSWHSFLTHQRSQLASFARLRILSQDERLLSSLCHLIDGCMVHSCRPPSLSFVKDERSNPYHDQASFNTTHWLTWPMLLGYDHRWIWIAVFEIELRLYHGSRSVWLIWLTSSKNMPSTLFKIVCHSPVQHEWGTPARTERENNVIWTLTKALFVDYAVSREMQAV